MNIPPQMLHGLRVKFVGSIAMDPAAMSMLPPIRLISIDLFAGVPGPG